MAGLLKKLKFRIEGPGGEVETVEFEESVVKIGRIEGAQLKLENEEVSRIHAVVEVTDDGSVRIIDLGSDSGTFVNGEEVPRAELDEGDDIRVGQTTLTIGFEDVDQTLFVEGEGRVKIKPAPEPDHQTPQTGNYEPVEIEHGEEVRPYEIAGFYDDNGRYIPGYYDEEGEFQYGYGYFTENDRWRIRFGFYSSDGKWVDTDFPVKAIEAVPVKRPEDREYFEHRFFEDTGGDTLEIAFLWHDHILKVDDWQYFDQVDVGIESDSAFVLPEFYDLDASFNLVERREDTDVLFFNPERMSGRLQRGGETIELVQLVESGRAEESMGRDGWYEIALTRQDCARVSFDSFVFFIHYTEKPDVGAFLFPMREKEWLPYFLGSAGLHLLILFLLLTIPAAAGSLNMDGLQSNNQFVELVVKPEQKEKKNLGSFGQQQNKEGSKKHKGDKGKAGQKSADESKDNKMAVKGPESKDKTQIKKRNQKVVQNAGAVAVIGKGEVSSIWGEGNETVGADAKDALGNLQGESVGAGKGVGGFAVEGTASGGGGSSTKGIGAIDTGTGSTGAGNARANVGKKESKVPEVVPGDPAVRGSLSREIIQRVVRQHRREIKYCYEMELQRHRTLKGRVKMKFTISTTGDVVAAVVEESSLNNATVERCIAGKIRHWQFPEPKGGGIVVVRYPFNFSS